MIRKLCSNWFIYYIVRKEECKYMLVHPTSTAASKGNRILNILEAPADVVEASTVVGELDVGGAEVAASIVEADVIAPDVETRKTQG
jgi:hypothetical protein